MNLLKKQIRPLIIMVVLAVLCLPCTMRAAGVEIMKVSQIKVGMEGVGKTIFKGTRAETFQFKVLGIVEKFAPGKNLIIVEVESPLLKGGGIVSGMSGSPAYIDGKLIGAVAYGFAFSRKPIGGITPIEDIIDIDQYNNADKYIKAPGPLDLSDYKIQFDKQNLAAVAEKLQKELVQRINPTPSSMMTPIPLLGTTRGLDPASVSLFKPLISMGNLSGHKSGRTTGQNQGKLLKAPALTRDILSVSPGDAVAVPLITGDFEYSASGAVTHVDGDKVYLFGHPFFNLGPVDFPLHKAEVLTVVPSYQESFKLTATRQMVGRVIQDRFSSVQGERGKSPRMIPMKIFLQNRNRRFQVGLVTHPLLTPVLSAVSLDNVFRAQYLEVGIQSIRVKGKIFIEGEQNIELNDLYTGSDSFSGFTNLVLAINFFLMNNPEKNINIQKLDFEISGSEILRRANIENVLINKNAFLPGEIMEITVYLKNEKGRQFSETLNLKAPNLKAGSEFYLMVADSEEMGRFEARNVKTNYFPDRLSLLIRAINNLRKNNRLYFKLMTPARGLFVKGHEYPNIPSGLRDVFNYNNPAAVYAPVGASQSPVKYSTLREYQLELPSVVKGTKLFKLTIKERTDAH